jgi:hypothetical protein
MIRNAVGVACLEDYHLLHRYNIKHICNPPEVEEGEGAKSKPAAATETDASKPSAEQPAALAVAAATVAAPDAAATPVEGNVKEPSDTPVVAAADATA